MESSNSVTYITNNFPIFGFGSAEMAILQSVKELLENSIDACRSCPLTMPLLRHSVGISISRDTAEALLVVEVRDTGVGLKSPTDLLRCFRSTKGGEQQTVSTGRHLQITTKSVLSATDEVVCSTIGLGADGSPVTVREVCTSAPEFQSGTLVKLYLPLDDMDFNGIKEAIEGVEWYCRLYTLIPNNEISIDLNVDLRSTVMDSPSTMQWSQTFVNQFAVTSRLPTSEETYGIALEAQVKTLLTQLKWHQRVKASTVALVKNEECLQIQVSASLLECTNCTAADPLLSSSKQRVHSQWENGGIPLKIWRYANGTPLYDFDDDALSCQITSAFRSFPWHTYGYKSRHVCGIASSVGLGMHGIADSHALLKAPNIILEPINEALQGDDNKQDTGMGNSLLFSVNIVSTKVTYGSMKKTNIAHDETIYQLLVGALKSVMNSLQANSDTEELFLSFKQHKKKLVHREYIPSVAASIDAMISVALPTHEVLLCKSIDMLNRCELQNHTTATATATVSSYQEILQRSLQDLHHMEEHR